MVVNRTRADVAREVYLWEEGEEEWGGGGMVSMEDVEENRQMM